MLHVNPDHFAQIEPERGYYVVAAKPGSLEQAYLRLANCGLKPWVPMIAKRAAARRAPTSNVQKLKTGARRSDEWVPRFGRYFFVHCTMSTELWAGINMLPGIEGVMVSPRAKGPVPLPQEYIEKLKADRFDLGRAGGDWFVGDVVRIKSGCFESFEAVVGEVIDSRSALKVEVNIFGRPSLILLGPDDVEMIKPAKSRVIEAMKKQNRPHSAAA